MEKIEKKALVAAVAYLAGLLVGQIIGFNAYSAIAVNFLMLAGAYVYLRPELEGDL